MSVLIAPLGTTLVGVKIPPSNSQGSGSGNFITNLLLQSEVLDNASWTKSQSTISANAAVAPNGASTADKLKEDNTTNFHLASQSVAITSGVVYTFSVFVKAVERTWVQVLLSASGFTVGTYAFVNLTTGAVGTTNNSPVVNVTDYGNGWYRISITKIATASVSAIFQIVLATGNGTNSYAGDNTSGILIWGAQLETGWTANTYIPTTTTAVTAEV